MLTQQWLLLHLLHLLPLHEEASDQNATLLHCKQNKMYRNSWLLMGKDEISLMMLYDITIF